MKSTNYVVKTLHYDQHEVRKIGKHEPSRENRQRTNTVTGVLYHRIGEVWYMPYVDGF